MNDNVAPGLYVVATPIGNLDDISPRALRVLAGVSVIAAEDTRHTRRLLGHFSIATPMVALHDHNERSRAPQLLERFDNEYSIALVSDAGTPLVSDPGFRLVRGAREQGVPVFAVPGPCSAIAALSIAGLPSDRFAFEGFLPAKSQARSTRLEQLVDSTFSLIFFVPTRQVDVILGEMVAVFGPDRPALLARELTKLHEQSFVAPLGEISAALSKPARGEFVLIVAAAKLPVTTEVAPEAQRILVRLLAELPLKRAVAVTVDLTGISRNKLYQLALSISDQS